GVFSVDDDEIRAELVAEVTEHAPDHAPAGRADDVADEEDRSQVADAIGPAGSCVPRPVEPWAHTSRMAEREEQIGAGGVEGPPFEPDPGAPLAPDPGATPHPVERVVVPRWIQ